MAWLRPEQKEKPVENQEELGDENLRLKAQKKNAHRAASRGAAAHKRCSRRLCWRKRHPRKREEKSVTLCSRYKVGRSWRRYKLRWARRRVAATRENISKAAAGVWRRGRRAKLLALSANGL